MRVSLDELTRSAAESEVDSLFSVGEGELLGEAVVDKVVGARPGGDLASDGRLLAIVGEVLLDLGRVESCTR